MPGLRIGIDVGGTFTHGVALELPGRVAASALTPTTHGSGHGVAEGVRSVLKTLLDRVDAQAVELVAHSTTQATNALLEGDVSPVARLVIVPPGETYPVRMALKGDSLSIGNGLSIPLATHYLSWDEALSYQDPLHGLDITGIEPGQPVAVVQPLAGKHEVLEAHVARACQKAGHPVVCASEITQVLGLAARARTATVNAAMLPTMLKTAEFTERAVNELLPGVPLQVVRSDGGAMSINAMREQPVLSLLSGPAAGASAALHRSGLSEVVFIEVGGTSTDITLVKEGRVRHRYATVGGQRLMVPALDLRTVAVGGGSMLLLGECRCGSRSAHIAGKPYAFSRFNDGMKLDQVCALTDGSPDANGESVRYTGITGKDGIKAAVTLTDVWLARLMQKAPLAVSSFLGREPGLNTIEQLNRLNSLLDTTRILGNTIVPVVKAIKELAAVHNASLDRFVLVGGGGGAPVITQYVAQALGMEHRIIENHESISAIGAALAVTCVSRSKTVSSPTGADIAELTTVVEDRLREQGAERVSTDFEYDQHRQVLTVTGRGNQPYAQSGGVLGDPELAEAARGFTGPDSTLEWQSPGEQLWVSGAATGKRGSRTSLGVLINRHGHSLWHGPLREFFAAGPGGAETVLREIIDRRTQFTDGGPALPGLALCCDGRFIPLDQLGEAALIVELLHWENLPKDAPGCFILRD